MDQQVVDIDNLDAGLNVLEVLMAVGNITLPTPQEFNSWAKVMYPLIDVPPYKEVVDEFYLRRNQRDHEVELERLRNVQDHS